MVLFKQISHTDTPTRTATWVSEGFFRRKRKKNKAKRLQLGIFLTNLQDPTIISVYFIKVDL